MTAIFFQGLSVKYIPSLRRESMQCVTSACHSVYISKQHAPEVPFRDLDEFTARQSEFVSSYSKLITDVFNSAFDSPQGSNRLTWTDRDMILYGMAEFPRLKVEGVQLILSVTKGMGMRWCVMVSSWMADIITAGCRGHARALMHWPVNTPTTNDVYSRTIRQEMLSGMYDNLGIFDQIFDASFVSFTDPTKSFVTTYTMANWRKIMLAFCMITHDRLCPSRSYDNIDSDVLHMILEFAASCHNRKLIPYSVFEYGSVN